MADRTSTVPSTRTQQAIQFAERRMEETWPGGMSAIFAEYRGNKITLEHITQKTGLLFRAIRRVFNKHGIQFRDNRLAGKVAHALNPGWAEKISRSKREKPFIHPRHVTEAATKKRLLLFARDPSRHGNAHVRLSSREKIFARLLDEAGIAYEFSKNAGKYWLDFWVKDFGIGVEIQRYALPVKSRDDVMCKTLNLSTCIYISSKYLVGNHIDYIRALIQAIGAEWESLAPAIGDHRFLTQTFRTNVMYWNQFRFRQRWSQPTDLPSQDRA